MTNFVNNVYIYITVKKWGQAEEGYNFLDLFDVIDENSRVEPLEK